jgi:high affinity Mn2+ porin
MTDFATFFTVCSARLARQATRVTGLSHFPAKAAAGETSMTPFAFRAALCGAPVALSLLAMPALADEASPRDQTYAIHGQYTGVVQGVGGFASPYASDNSLDPKQTKMTNDVTLYLGLRPWKGADLGEP